MSSEEKMEMLTNAYKKIDTVWSKYKNTWTCESCKVRDAIIIILAVLIIII